MQITRLYAVLLVAFLFSATAAATATAQVFDAGRSAPALFTNVINAPGDVLPASVGGDDLRRSLDALAGSEINFSGGLLTSGLFFIEGGEVNVSGGTIGQRDGTLSGLLADEPLVLELEVAFGGKTVRQEISVVESQKFLVVTRLDDNSKWKFSGDVGAIVDGVATVNLRFEHERQSKVNGSLINTHTQSRDLRLDEYSGGGGGSNRLLISDLWLRRGEDPLPALLKALSKRDEKSCVATSYLARLGPQAKGAVKQLVRLMKEPDFCPNGKQYNSLRMYAAKALGAIGEPANESATQPLLTATADANGYVRVAASRALWATSKHGKAIPSLIKCSKDDEWGVRLAACSALGDIGQDTEEAEGVVEALANALADQQSGVRFHAVFALEKLGAQTSNSPFAVAKLKGLSDDPDADVRKMIARLLKNLDL